MAPSQLLARRLLQARLVVIFCDQNMYKSVGFAFLHLDFRVSGSGHYYLLPLMVPCIGEAAGGVFEAGLRKVSGKA